MNFHDLGDLPPDGQDRVQRRHGILEHHRDAVAPERAHVLRSKGTQVAAFEQDLAAGDPARRVAHEAHHRESGHRLARP